jgi:hypothetical protein
MLRFLHELLEDFLQEQDKNKRGQHEGDHPEEGKIVAWRQCKRESAVNVLGTEPKKKECLYSRKGICDTKRYNQAAKPHVNERHLGRLLCLLVDTMV